MIVILFPQDWDAISGAERSGDPKTLEVIKVSFCQCRVIPASMFDDFSSFYFFQNPENHVSGRDIKG